MTQSTPSGHLRGLGVLRFRGPDALSFLQGQVSNDTRRLAADASTAAPLLAAYSTPQGRVLAVLTLLPHSSGVIAVLPRPLVPTIHERLRKFVMRAKVQIEDLSESWAVAGQHGSDALTAAGLAVAAARYIERDGVGVGRRSPRSERYWVVGAAATLGELGLLGDANQALSIDEAWRMADIRDGLPQVYEATSETFVAQMLNLDLLDGISFTKGCFTGQEIIARTQHLGRIKRRLFRLRLPAGVWAIGQTLRLADGRSGRLTELAGSGEHVEALAVLNVEAAADAETPTETAVPASELSLPYSLG